MGTTAGTQQKVDRIRVVVGDDHPLIREALEKRLEAAEDIELVGDASSGQEILDLLERLEGKVDVAILDIYMPPVTGLEATDAIRESFPGVEVLILTGLADTAVVADGLHRGAKGYVLKHRDAKQLVEAVRLVAAGTIVIDPDLVEAVAGHLLLERSERESLTERELHVLQLAASGKSNEGIAKDIFASKSTVKGDLERIMAKLNASDRTSAVAEALRRQLID